jgi:hypothetical protein
MITKTCKIDSKKDDTMTSQPEKNFKIENLSKKSKPYIFK